MRQKKAARQAVFYTVLRRVKKKHPDLMDWEARNATIAIVRRVYKKETAAKK